MGAGLAAPQIGVGLRVVIFGFEDNPRYPDADAVPFTVLINPVLTPLGRPPGRGLGRMPVGPRHARAGAALPRICATPASTPPGAPIDRTVRDFHARVVQHEVDHLDGILYPRRIRDLTQFGFNEALFPGEDLHDD